MKTVQEGGREGESWAQGEGLVVTEDVGFQAFLRDRGPLWAPWGGVAGPAVSVVGFLGLPG